MSVIQIFNYIFGSRSRFEIFKNPDYEGHYSVRHRGGYLYINPPHLGGAGISFDRGACASHSVEQHAIDMIERWKKLYYEKGN